LEEESTRDCVGILEIEEEEEASAEKDIDSFVVLDDEVVESIAFEVSVIEL
jgi:hypothetical protein